MAGALGGARVGRPPTEDGGRLVSHPPVREAGLAVISDNAGEAALVESLLADEFDGIQVLIVDQGARAKPLTQCPKVLILAFKQVAIAEEFYLGCYRQTDAALLGPHRTVLLCTKEEVTQAYDLCRRGLFDDYALFWPIGLDVKRLLMAVHGALRNLAIAPAGPEREPPGTRNIDPQPGAIERRRTALVVDDDSAQRKLVGRFLEAEDLILEYASSGTDALRLLSGMEPDIMLLDLKMPNMDGLQLLKRLKEQRQRRSFPVIMMTGSAERDVVRSTLENGAVDFLVKPFGRDSLLTKVRRALERDGSPTAEPVGM
jgi:CheY-like chemotaxis protein